MDKHHAEVTANIIGCNVFRKKLMLIICDILSCPVLTLENQEQGSATRRIDLGTKPSIEKIITTGQNVQLSINRTEFSAQHYQDHIFSPALTYIV